MRHTMATRVQEVILALALCHNVTPAPSGDQPDAPITYQASRFAHVLALKFSVLLIGCLCSPDEVALVKFTESVGLVLADRSTSTITLRTPAGYLDVRIRIIILISRDLQCLLLLCLGIQEYEVLNLFPFSSERKRMGVIVRHKAGGPITFYMKGAGILACVLAMFSLLLIFG